MFDMTMPPNDLVFDVPPFAPSSLSPLSPGAIRPLPFHGMAPRDLYLQARAIPGTHRQPSPGGQEKRLRLKQLLIPILRRIGYTGTMERRADASPTAHS